MHVVVIGAGMSGLCVAALRVKAGDAVTVLDKGRRPGGRMATRRVGEAVFDTGVLSFAAHGRAFRDALAVWADAGHATDRTDPDGRWRGHPTMRDLPSALAEHGGAQIHLATTVTGLAITAGRWHLTADGPGGAQTFSADALVVTTPAPQALDLLTRERPLASPTTLAHLAAVTYEPSLTVLARPTTGPPATPVDEPVLAGIHHNDLTGASSVVALTLRASLAASTTSLDADRDATARRVAAEASSNLGTALEVVHVHGWRYAQVARGIDLPALRDDSAGAPLVLAGDLFEVRDDGVTDVRLEGVERAFASASTAARLLDHA
jgi:renalase